MPSHFGGTSQTIAGRKSDSMILARGNLPGQLGGTNPNLEPTRKNTGKSKKFQIKHFSYPSDVDSDPMQGHYIMFNISTLTPAILKAEKRSKDMKAFRRQITREANLKELDKTGRPPQLGGTAFGLLTKQQSIDAQVLKAFPPDKKLPTTGRLNRSFGLSTMPRTLLNTSIALYMPASLSVNYGVTYAEEEIGSLAEVGTGMIKAFTQGGDTLSSLKGAFSAATGAAAQEGIQAGILKTLDTVASGAKALAQLDTGKVITPRMELMFRGVGRRSFSFTFTFIPKSEWEAQQVENIIYTFKENMHPEYTNESTRKEMRIPNTFEISYMYQNTENVFLNKISTCFLTTLGVTYGGDRFTAYEPTIHWRQGVKSPPPQKSSITLGFTELETLSKQHIQQGY